MLDIYKMQREQTLEKVPEGVTERALQCLWNPPGPYGYACITKERSSNGDGELVVNEAQAAVLAAIAERYGHGEALTPLCRERGLNPSTVHYLFSPERIWVYVGKVPFREHTYNWKRKRLEPFEKRWIPGKHEPILTDDIIDLVLERKERQGTCLARHALIEYLRCGVCDRRFYVNADRHGNPTVVCEHAR